MSRLLLFFFLLGATALRAQYGAYFYIVTPHQVDKKHAAAKYESAYALRAVQPFGEDGIEQRIGGVYGISDRLSLSAVASTIIESGGSSALGAGQVELMVDLKRAAQNGFSLGLGGAWLQEYQGVHTAQARLAASWRQGAWSVDSNALLQKPFAEYRDAVDMIFSFGASYRLHPSVRIGFEALGEDLEGFIEEEEAEGGAKLLLGPVLHVSLAERLHMRMGGGPIYYLTRSDRVSSAPRLLPATPDRSGLMVRISALYTL